LPAVTAVSFPIRPADRFAATLDGLCRAVAARAAAERTFAPLALLLWGWLRRVAARFAATAARVEAGRLHPPRPARPAAPRRVSPPAPRLPRGFAWVLRAVPASAGIAGQLQNFLAEPDVVDLLAAAPQLARPLRPLCRMLGIRPLPPPHRTRPAPPPPACAASRPARRDRRTRDMAGPEEGAGERPPRSDGDGARGAGPPSWRGRRHG
jgi:hypothetical protein